MAIRRLASWKTVACLIAMAGVLVPVPAAAQATSSGTSTPLSGDIVWVTSAGKTQKGRVSGVSAESIGLIADERLMTFKAGEIQRLERQIPDSPRDGLWKGALAGAAVGAVLAATSSGCSSNTCFVGRGEATMAGALLFAGFGVPAGFAIDALYHGREAVALPPPRSARFELSPIVTMTGAGTRLTLRW